MDNPSVDLTIDEEAMLIQQVNEFAAISPIAVSADRLEQFLTSTQSIRSTSARRLRWLAIELEHEDFVNGWFGLRDIYAMAHQLDHSDPFVLHSWGMSAIRWFADYRTPSMTDRITIAEEAEQVLCDALNLAPGDSYTAHALGLLNYNHPNRVNSRNAFRSRAIEWFSKAVAWDQTNVIAQLYLAHCFHDNKDWNRAIIEYEKVDLEQLSLQWLAWRTTKCREQLIACYAKSGATAKAIELTRRFLDEAEQWTDSEAADRILNLWELVETVAHDLNDLELSRRTHALCTRLGFGDRG